MKTIAPSDGRGRLLRTFLILAILSSVVALIVFFWFPSARPLLVDEDRLVENISAALFLGAFLIAAVGLAVHRGRGRGFLLVLAGIGLLFFLDEMSFGERLFDLTMPVARGKKIDAVHDLLTLALNAGRRQILATPMFLVAGVGAGLMLLFALLAAWLYRRGVLDRFWVMWRSTHGLLLSISAVLVLVAILLDLDLIGGEGMAAIEEMVEMHAGLALIFSALAAFRAASLDAPQPHPAAERQDRRQRTLRKPVG